MIDKNMFAKKSLFISFVKKNFFREYRNKKLKINSGFSIHKIG